MSEAASTVVVPMPHMGVSVEEGTVIEWLVAVGDTVSAGQAICAVATDKVDTEIAAPADGLWRNCWLRSTRPLRPGRRWQA